jgi:hypothetical protein
VVLAVAAAFWSIGDLVRRLGEPGHHDPSWVVIDELAGQWIALLPVAIGAEASGAAPSDLWPGWLAAFLLFRLFDVWKPGAHRLGGPATRCGRRRARRPFRRSLRGGGGGGARRPVARADAVTLAERLLAAAQEKGLMVATAESCTGGLLAGAITMPPGASAIFDRGVVTYTNDAKRDLLGVRAGTLRRMARVRGGRARDGRRAPRPVQG